MSSDQLQNKRSRVLTVIVATLIGIVILLPGIYLGGHSHLLPNAVRNALIGSPTQQTASQVVELIGSNYFQPTAEQRLTNAAARGAIASLGDRFSAYFTPSEFRAFLQSTEGEFSGIGVSVSKTRQGLRIIEVFQGSPAAAAKLRRGDLITTVNGRSVAAQPATVATELIKGKPGTTVTITVLRDGQRFTKRIRRATVGIPAVTVRSVKANGKQIAVVKLSAFTAPAAAQFRAAVESAVRRKVNGLILDLRNNPGGLLSEAVEVVSVFIADGKVVTTKGRDQPTQQFDATGEVVTTKLPVVVLVNHQTASSAEIVAGALQDRHRATLVGQRTFGKGVFQRLLELNNHGALELTTGQFFLPSGRNIGNGKHRGAGIKPNLVVSPSQTEQVAVKLLVRDT